MSSGAWASGEVDLDTLADYTAGVLEPADEAAVAHLIGTDLRWQHAHAALVAADAAVRADLHAAAGDLTMPADVVARLDTALAAESGGGGAVVVSIDAARSRRRRLATTITAAAAAVVAVAGGLTVAGTWRGSIGSTTMAEAPAFNDGGRGTDAAAPEAAGGLPDHATLRVVASGRDYNDATARDVLGEAAAIAPQAKPPAMESSAGAGEQTTKVDSDVAARTAGTPLARLTMAEALDACLRLIAAIVPGTPGVVDYARFNGSPALVVLIRQATASMIVVVGPECGLNDADLVTTLTT